MVTPDAAGFEYHLTVRGRRHRRRRPRRWWSGGLDRTREAAFGLKAMRRRGAAAPEPIPARRSGELFELEEQLRQTVAAFRERRALVCGEDARKASPCASTPSTRCGRGARSGCGSDQDPGGTGARPRCPRSARASTGGGRPTLAHGPIRARPSGRAHGTAMRPGRASRGSSGATGRPRGPGGGAAGGATAVQVESEHMAGRSPERKLAAILSADAEGYSRLMGDDEAATVRTITEYREAIASTVAGHGGRVVDAPGDNVLAEFPSVVDAAQCAIEIQRELRVPQRRAAGRPPDAVPHRDQPGRRDRRGRRLYGDGVNIAARVEGLAEGGGICLSGTAYDQVEGKLPFDLRLPRRAHRQEHRPAGARVSAPPGRATPRPCRRPAGGGSAARGRDRWRRRPRRAPGRRRVGGLALARQAGAAGAWPCPTSRRSPCCPSRT